MSQYIVACLALSVFLPLTAANPVIASNLRRRHLPYPESSLTGIHLSSRDLNLHESDKRLTVRARSVTRNLTKLRLELAAAPTNQPCHSPQQPDYDADSEAQMSDGEAEDLDDDWVLPPEPDGRLFNPPGALPGSAMPVRVPAAPALGARPSIGPDRMDSDALSSDYENISPEEAAEAPDMGTSVGGYRPLNAWVIPGSAGEEGDEYIGESRPSNPRSGDDSDNSPPLPQSFPSSGSLSGDQPIPQAAASVAGSQPSPPESSMSNLELQEGDAPSTEPGSIAPPAPVDPSITAPPASRPNAPPAAKNKASSANKGLVLEQATGGIMWKTLATKNLKAMERYPFRNLKDGAKYRMTWAPNGKNVRISSILLFTDAHAIMNKQSPRQNGSLDFVYHDEGEMFPWYVQFDCSYYSSKKTRVITSAKKKNKVPASQVVFRLQEMVDPNFNQNA
ncbi:MAG: hypothetical protein M1825_006375 [Sarcosagium campestre]|nr:MAG: hypothetical protein M1825_006375 [Sarcosagium campestre]